MHPYNVKPVNSIIEPIHCSTCTIHPPPQTHPWMNLEIPSRCKTIHVHGMPKNTTELVIKDIFKRFGNITGVGMKTTYWIVSFWMQHSVDAALALSGWKVSIGDSQDIDDTGQISIDCPKAENGYEWKTVKQERKVNAASESKQTQLLVPLSGMHHNGKALELDAAIKESEDDNTVLNSDKNSDLINACGDNDDNKKDDVPEVEKENVTEIRKTHEQLVDHIRRWRNLLLEHSQRINLKLVEAEREIENQNSIIDNLAKESIELLASLRQGFDNLLKLGDVLSETETSKEIELASPSDDDEWSSDVSFETEEMFDLKEAKLIGLMTTFLLVHPFGIGFDYISKYVRRIVAGVEGAELHSLLKRCRSVFKFELTKGWTLNTFSAGDQPISTSRSAEETHHIPPNTSKLPKEADSEILSDCSSVVSAEEQLSIWRERRRLQNIMEHFKEGWSAGFERRIQEFRKSEHPWGVKRRKRLRISENEFWKFTIPSITPDRLRWLKENVPIPDKYEEEYVLEQLGLLPNVCDEEDTGEMDVAGSNSDLNNLPNKSLLPVHDYKRSKRKSRSGSNRADRVDCATNGQATATEESTKTEKPTDENPGMVAISKPLHDMNVVPDSPHLKISTSDRGGNVPDARNSATRPPEISDGSRCKHTKDPASAGDQRQKPSSENFCHSKNADNKVSDPSVLKVLVKTALADNKRVDTKTETKGEPNMSVKATKSLISDDPLNSSRSLEAKTLDKAEETWKREKKTNILLTTPSSSSGSDKKNGKGPTRTSEIQDVCQTSSKFRFSSLEEEHRLARILTRFNKSHYWSPELKKRLQQFVPQYGAKTPFRLLMASSIGTIIEVSYFPLTPEQVESLAGVVIPQKYPEEYFMEKEAAKNRDNPEGWLFTPEGRARLSRVKINNDWKLWSPELRKALETLRPANCLTNYKSHLFRPDGTFKRVNLPAVTLEELKKINDVVVPEKLLEEYIDEMSGGSDDSFIGEEKNASLNSSGRDNANLQMQLDVPIDHEIVMKDVENTIDVVQKFFSESIDKSKPVKKPANVDSQETKKRKVLDNEDNTDISIKRKLDHDSGRLVEIKTVKGPTDKEEISNLTNFDKITSDRKEIENVNETSRVANPIEPTTRKISSKRKSNHDERKSTETRDRKAPRVETHVTKDNQTACAFTMEVDTGTPIRDETIVEGSKNSTTNNVSLKNSVDKNITLPSPIVMLKKITSDKISVHKNMTEPSAIPSNKTSKRKSDHHDKKHKAAKDNEKICESTKKVENSTKGKKENKKETQPSGQKVQEKTTANITSFKKKSDRREKKPEGSKDLKTTKPEKPNTDIDKERKSDQSSECIKSHTAKEGVSDENKTEPSTIVPEKTPAKIDSVKKKSDHHDRNPVKNRDTKIPRVEKSNLQNDTTFGTKNKEKKSTQNNTASNVGGSEIPVMKQGCTYQLTPKFVERLDKVKKIASKRKSDHRDRKPVKNKEAEVSKSNAVENKNTTCESEKSDKNNTQISEATDVGSKTMDEMVCSNQLELNSNKKGELLGPKADGNEANPFNRAKKIATKRKSDHHDRIPAYNKEPIYAEKRVAHLREEPCIIPLERQDDTGCEGPPCDPRLGHYFRTSKNATQFLTVPVWNTLPAGDLEMNTNDNNVTSASGRDCNGDGPASSDNVDEPPKKLFKKIDKRPASSSFRSKTSSNRKGLDRKGEKKSSSGRKSKHLDRKSIENKVTKKPNVERYEKEKTCEAAMKETVCTPASEKIEAGARISIPEIQGDSYNPKSKTELLGRERKILLKDDTKTCEAPVKENVVEAGATISIPVQIQIDSHNSKDKNELLDREVESKIMSEDDTKTCEPALIETICTPRSENIDEPRVTFSIPVRIKGETQRLKTRNKPPNREIDKILLKGDTQTCQPAMEETICTPGNEKIAETRAMVSVPAHIQGESQNLKDRNRPVAREIEKILPKDYTKTCEPAMKEKICTPANENTEPRIAFSIPVRIQGETESMKTRNKPVAREIEEILLKDDTKTCEPAMAETICTRANENIAETREMVSVSIHIQGESQNLKDRNKPVTREIEKILPEDDTKTCEPAMKEKICTPSNENIAEARVTVSIPQHKQGDSKDTNELLGREVKSELLLEDGTETCETSLQEAICTPAGENSVETVVSISILHVHKEDDSHNPKDKPESSGQDVDSDVLESSASSVTIKAEPEDNPESEMNTSHNLSLHIKDEPVDEKNSDDFAENTGKITITVEDVLSSVHNESDDNVSKSTSDTGSVEKNLMIPKSPVDKEPSADGTVTKEDMKKRKSIDERPHQERRRSTESSNKHTDTYQINENKSDESKQTDAVLMGDGQSVVNPPSEYSNLEMLFKVFGHSDLRRLNQITRHNFDGETSQNDCVVDDPENDPKVCRNDSDSVLRNTADSEEALNTSKSDKAVEKCTFKQEPTEFVEPSVNELRVKQEPPEPEEHIQSSATFVELSENTQLIRNQLDDLLGGTPDKQFCDTYWSSKDLQRLAGDFV